MNQRLCVFACFAMAGLPGMAQHVTILPDHYKCYNFPTLQPFTTTISLRDQFDIALDRTEQIGDLRPFRLCNPVEKTIRRSKTPISRSDLHYTMFLIPPEEIVARDVVVFNQFGRQELHTRDAKVLMAPTGKTKCPIGGCSPTTAPPLVPDKANHYKCYSAAGKRILASARLEDQFHTEFVRVLEPILFCNPVEKVDAAGNKFEIVNAATHLTCYTITRVPILRDVIISNQFGSVTTRVANADILCAPSQKVKWAPVPGLTAAGAELE
ncbi:MAG: DUF7450 family protein [Bryobacteraceae bacterium]